MTHYPPEGGRFATRAPFVVPVAFLSVVLAMLLSTGLAAAHAVAEGDKGYIQEITGVHLIPFMYLGAKHMVTGYDHLLFLFGVIFFLYRLKHIGIYVSLFAIGHSTTMIMGVYFGWNVSSYLIDAIIGLSVVYKALDNLGRLPALVRLPAEHQAGDADLRLLPRPRSRDQDPGIRHRAGRPAAQPARLQCRRGDRPAARARGHPHPDGVLAADNELLETRLHRQRPHDDRRVRADRISAHRIFRRLRKEIDHVQFQRSHRRANCPRPAQLVKSTAIAIVAAAAILVTIVLPSEYGIDPTGAGRALGLTEMGEIKTQLAEEAEQDRIRDQQNAAPAPATPQQGSGLLDRIYAEFLVGSAQAQEARTDEMSVTLAPGEGAEIKLVMVKGAQANYSWTANGAAVNFDTHGDGGGENISYEKGRGVAEDEGVLEAAFDGNHGWFWRNRTDADVTVTLKTSGAYTDIKRVM